MDPLVTTRTIDSVLTELAEVVAVERGALKQLDSAVLEHCAATKLALDEELRARATELEPRHHSKLQELDATMKSNQILLIHARDQVLGTLSLLGGSTSGVGGSKKLPSGAVRLSTKG